MDELCAFWSELCVVIRLTLPSSSTCELLNSDLQVCRLAPLWERKTAPQVHLLSHSQSPDFAAGSLGLHAPGKHVQATPVNQQHSERKQVMTRHSGSAIGSTTGSRRSSLMSHGRQSSVSC
jgi:hypothetical protein